MGFRSTRMPCCRTAGAGSTPGVKFHAFRTDRARMCRTRLPRPTTGGEGTHPTPDNSEPRPATPREVP